MPMDEDTRTQLWELTCNARAAYAEIPDEKIEAAVDAAVAEVREEMTAELIRAGKIELGRRPRKPFVRHRGRTPQSV